MTNIIAMVVVALTTNVTSVQVHENCITCENGSNHSIPLFGTFTNAIVWPPQLESPRNVRKETTEIIETATIHFEWEGTNDVAFHNRIVSRTVRRFKTKQIEEEVK